LCLTALYIFYILYYILENILTDAITETVRQYIQYSKNIFEKFSKLLCSLLVYLYEVIGKNRSAQEILVVTVCLALKGQNHMWFWMGPIYS